jgi:hypothetical protein
VQIATTLQGFVTNPGCASNRSIRPSFRTSNSCLNFSLSPRMDGSMRISRAQVPLLK